MSAMAVPVISRNAATMSSLMKQKPVSSLVLTVPRNARLNSAVFTITVLPASLVLNDGVSDGIKFSLGPMNPNPSNSLPPRWILNNDCKELAVTGVIGLK